MKEQDLIDLGFTKQIMEKDEEYDEYYFYSYDLSWNFDLLSSSSDKSEEEWTVWVDVFSCTCWETPREILDNLNADIKNRKDLIITDANDLKVLMEIFKKYEP